MARVTDPLTSCGARFHFRGEHRLPLTICGTGSARSFTYRLPVASAQVKSAILLAGLNARGETVVDEPEATRDHTENMLRHFGARVDVSTRGVSRIITVRGQPELLGAAVVVPGDPSSAAFPLVAATLVPGSTIKIRGLGVNTHRTGLLTTLREMGARITQENARVESGEQVADIVVSHADLQAVDVPPERAPSMIDEYPVLAVAAACAQGVTRMRGLRELRVKESDRLSATAALLQSNGVEVAVEGDDLLVTGTGRPPLGGGSVATQMDHRLAMSALVLGLIARNPVVVDDLSFIDTSFPGFVALMNQLGAGLRCD